MELDCRGMRCPLPIIKLATALKESEEVILLSDDPATLPDLSAWARMTGNFYEVVGTNKYFVKRL
jgi:tRNA 2-thiouridine synthesizing protein A